MTRGAARLILPSILLLVAACGPTGEPDPIGDHPCAATWGFSGADAGVIHVDAAASDGDGSLAAPLTTLGAGLELARSTGDRTIAIAPGTYRPSEADRSFALADVFDDDDLVLAGCGADQTVLEAIVTWPVGTDETTPGAEQELQRVFDVYGPVQGVEIRDLAVEGGHRGMAVRLGAGSERPIVLEGLRVDGNLRTGILVQGRDTAVDIVDCVVRDTVSDDEGELGYGITAQAIASPWDEVTGRVVIEGGRIEAATRVGLMVDRSMVEVVGLEVLDTEPVEGELGRGMQLQNSAAGLIEGVRVSGNSDAGLFLQMPLDVTVRDSTFEATARADIPDFDEHPSGDGLCATQSEAGTDPTDWSLTLEGNTFADNGRAGALVEGVEVFEGVGNEYTGNSLVGDTVTFPLAPDVDALFVQGGAVVGSGEAVELGGGGPWGELDMYRELLALDDLAE